MSKTIALVVAIIVSCPQVHTVALIDIVGQVYIGIAAQIAVGTLVVSIAVLSVATTEEALLVLFGNERRIVVLKVNAGIAAHVAALGVLPAIVPLHDGAHLAIVIEAIGTC